MTPILLSNFNRMWNNFPTDGTMTMIMVRLFKMVLPASNHNCCGWWKLVLIIQSVNTNVRRTPSHEVSIPTIQNHQLQILRDIIKLCEGKSKQHDCSKWQLARNVIQMLPMLPCGMLQNDIVMGGVHNLMQNVRFFS